MFKIDLMIFNFIHQFSGKFGIFDVIGIFFAQYVAYLLVLFVIILFFKEKGWKNRFYFFTFVVLSVILSRGIITEVIRFFYHHSRPFVLLGFEPLISGEISYSFPSGHMTFYSALFMVVFYIVKRNKDKVSKNWTWMFLGTVVLMGLARIYAGVHWPSDILGGMAIGVISALFVKDILLRNFKKIAPLTDLSN